MNERDIHPRLHDRVICAVCAVLVAGGIGIVFGLYLRGFF